MSFQKVFITLLKKTQKNYKHSRKIINNIVEEDVKNKIIELIDGKCDEINEIFTYTVHGDKTIRK